MDFEGKNKKPLSINDALIDIDGLFFTETAPMGGNDIEFPTLKNIKDQLISRAIEPEEAIRQARQLREGKQDYH